MQLLQAGLLLSCAVLTIHAADVVCGAGRTKKIVTLKAGESANFYTSAPGTDYKKNVKCQAVFKRAKKNKCQLNFSCEAFTLTAANAKCKGRSDFFTVSTVKKTRFCKATPDTSTKKGKLTVNFISNKRSKGGLGAVCTATCLAPVDTTPAPPATTDGPPATTAAPPAITVAPTPVTGATAPPTTAGTTTAPPPPPTTTTTTAPPPTTTNTTSGLRQQILADVFSVWQAFRDPLNGFWCDGLRFNYPEELVPCGPSNNFYSSAGTGMGLVSETIAVELGILTRQEGEERVRLTIETVLSSWPRENDHGFLQHFTHRNYLPVAEYSTIDTTILALGALFAGNYFGGDVALLADTLVESVQWSDAIKNATRPRMYGSTKIKNAPEMKGNMWPYSEYYLLAYLANKTSAPGSKAARYFATYMGNDGEPPRDGVEPHPVPVNYFGHQLLSDGGHFPSSFIPQFNYYLSRGAQTNPFYVTLFQEWLLADKLFWEKTLTADANIWGTPVAGRLWGAGAGPAPSGYGVEQINNSKDLVMSAAIMAGFLPAAREQMREEINSQLEWLYTNDVCSYPVLQNGNTAKILWRCSARLPDWRCPSVDSIDFSSFILGYSTNFLPADFFQTYSA